MVSHHAVTSSVTSEEVITKLVLFEESFLGLLCVVGLFIDEVVLEAELISHHAGSLGVASEEVVSEFTSMGLAGTPRSGDTAGPFEIVSHHHATGGVGSEEVVSEFLTSMNGTTTPRSVDAATPFEIVSHHAVSSGVASQHVVREFLTSVNGATTPRSADAATPFEFVSETLDELHGLIILVFHSILDEVFLEGELVSHHAGSSGVASEDIVGEHIVKFIN